MSRRTYLLAISSIFALLVGVIESLTTTLTLVQAGIPRSWLSMTLVIVSIAASFYALVEIRRLLRVLRRPTMLIACLNMALLGAFLTSVILGVLAFRSSTLVGLLLIWATCIPIGALTIWRAAIIDQNADDQFDLFNWFEQQQRAAERNHELEALRQVQAEYDELLRKNPELAARERLPMSARIRGGDLP